LFHFFRTRKRKHSKTCSEEDEDEEEDKEFCDYCHDGYRSDDYYSHMALKHFMEIFLLDVPNAAPFKCSLCTYFEADTAEKLIVHKAQYHKQLDRVLYMIQDQDAQVHDIFEELIETRPVTKELNLYRCKKCSVVFQNIQDLRLHVKDHIKWYVFNILAYILVVKKICIKIPQHF
jgi:hypothetical protein